MRNLIAIALALVTITAVMPVASASETTTADYTGGGVRVLGRGLGIMCPNSCLDEETFGDQPNLGGANLVASTFYNNVIVSVADDFYGSDAGFSLCFWNPEGDNICDSEEDYRSGVDCGVRALTGSPFAGDFVTVFSYGFVVTEDLNVCGSTSGTYTGNFF